MRVMLDESDGKEVGLMRASCLLIYGNMNDLMTGFGWMEVTIAHEIYISKMIKK